MTFTGTVSLDLKNLRNMSISPWYRWGKLRHMEIKELSRCLSVSIQWHGAKYLAQAVAEGTLSGHYF